ncbi:unnamed protein product [Linum tenue]|uniref:Uncharacterized protein n=1 Tax=Linum tenue TaxID=586396 RepID=A0AAV0KNW4_9ROSI|nr:unnamed protein product [Linum tenue]
MPPFRVPRQLRPLQGPSRRVSSCQRQARLHRPHENRPQHRVRHGDCL